MSELTNIYLEEKTLIEEKSNDSDSDIDTKIVFNALKAYLNDKNARININGKNAYIINRIMQSFPNIIHNMDNHVRKITTDNSIDMNDLPQLILMVKDVININSKDLKTISISRSEAINFIKDVIFILIDSNVIKTKDNKDTILALLNLSIQILEASIDLNETIKCNKWCCY